MKRLILLLFVVITLSNCDTQMEEAALNEWPNGVCYEIFIQSFADSNGDGIGDIPGATSKLDYLADLGIRAVWLMPIMPSPTYHKYDVTDYKGIHPDYGTMDDFKTFVKEAHKRNIKVIIDMIINHSSSEHPWFKEASKGKDNPYREYYVWADKDSIADQIAKKEVTQDSDNITQWHAVNGDTLAEHYYGFFYGGMPDLNFDSDKLKQEIFDIGKFWLEDVDVDGFRLDAAKHIFSDDRIEDSYTWWAEYRDEMQKIKPDVYIVGEVWAPASITKYFVKGLPSLFNFDLAGSINQSVLQGRNVASTIKGPRWVNVEGKRLVESLLENSVLYKEAYSEFRDAIFLSNHDQNRIMSTVENDKAKAKLAASILLTLPGSPYLYYGEEIGMRGMKPDENIREPFLWKTNDDKMRTSWMEPTYSTEETVLPVDEQMKDPNSIYSHYKQLIRERNRSEVLQKGDIEDISTENDQLLAYKRILGENEMSIYHNLSGEVIEINGETIQPYSTLIIQ